MAMALVHGGSAVHILSRPVFNYLTGMKPLDIIVDVMRFQIKMLEASYRGSVLY